MTFGHSTLGSDDAAGWCAVFNALRANPRSRIRAWDLRQRTIMMDDSVEKAAEDEIDAEEDAAAASLGPMHRYAAAAAAAGGATDREVEEATLRALARRRPPEEEGSEAVAHGHGGGHGGHGGDGHGGDGDGGDGGGGVLRLHTATVVGSLARYAAASISLVELQLGSCG